MLVASTVYVVFVSVELIVNVFASVATTVTFVPLANLIVSVVASEPTKLKLAPPVVELASIVYVVFVSGFATHDITPPVSDANT